MSDREAGKKAKITPLAPETEEEALLRTLWDDERPGLAYAGRHSSQMVPQLHPTPSPTPSSDRQHLVADFPFLVAGFPRSIAPFAGFDNHGLSCFIAAALAVAREMEGVCERLENEGLNPWAANILSAVRTTASGKVADTTKLHTLLKARFPLNTQADAVEFLEVILSLSFAGDVCALLRNTSTNTVTCVAAGCKHSVETAATNMTMKVHVPVGDRVELVSLMVDVRDHVEMVEWTCAKCGSLKGLSVDHLGDPPRYLIVELVRDKSGVGARTSVHVAPEIRVRGCHYSLRATVYFTGITPVSGHYLCSVRHGGLEWLQNDEKVVPMGADFQREELAVAALYEASTSSTS